MTEHLNSFSSKAMLEVGGKRYAYFDIRSAEANGLDGISRLPRSLKILLENLLRNEDGESFTAEQIRAFANWQGRLGDDIEISFRPTRVLTHDFTGIPLAADLAAMRDALSVLGKDPQEVNPLVPVDLIIDHSVIIDHYGSTHAFHRNVEAEYRRNGERYKFLKWAQGAFDRFRVVPPDTGICHQINLEYLAQVVWTEELDGKTFAFPDTVIGTDSHTTMINGLSVLGWGVGGIEAEAAMLGEPSSMVVPDVVGMRLTGRMAEGLTATDLVLRITNVLRAHGVVGKFVEFFGPGLDHLALEDRATIANMAPEYGATCGYFPIDSETIRYLTQTSRSPERVALVESYSRAQGLFRAPGVPDPIFAEVIELDLSGVRPSLAGPKRPQDILSLDEVAASVPVNPGQRPVAVPGQSFELDDGAVVLAAITSCTNTSNPSVMIGAALLARNAARLGLRPKPWVKTSIAPGSQIVGEYLTLSGLQPDLDTLGFHLAAYGCTTCIGNSGPLVDGVSEAINAHNITAAAVLSGNRNFEARINPDVSASYLASPPLVVAYALAGTVKIDFGTEPIGLSEGGRPVYLRDIWPSGAETAAMVRKTISAPLFASKYATIGQGNPAWDAVEVAGGATYKWDPSSTYVRKPPFFEELALDVRPVAPIEGARILGMFGDSITTDHISPAGTIGVPSLAGGYLASHQVRPAEFNQFGTRRGNHEVMVRGAFANPRIENRMLEGAKGGLTRHYPSGEVLPIYETAMRYRSGGFPSVVLAGREFGTGSSRDWAAKGPLLLGVRAVIAKSFERIHRSNLVGMGVLPLTFQPGDGWKELGLTGSELISIPNLEALEPRASLTVRIMRADGAVHEIRVICRIDTNKELEYFRNGGVLPFMVRKFAA
ncbi:aconitate hydratase AcnA [Faunimonas sp. B44]|uniref:aconitate hydratase AcnA n=1 Tax=Faunimonas sp. B44 TaxID=3461493 RepID=UPI0040450A19